MERSTVTDAQRAVLQRLARDQVLVLAPGANGWSWRLVPSNEPVKERTGKSLLGSRWIDDGARSGMEVRYRITAAGRAVLTGDAYEWER